MRSSGIGNINHYPTFAPDAIVCNYSKVKNKGNHSAYLPKKADFDLDNRQKHSFWSHIWQNN